MTVQLNSALRAPAVRTALSRRVRALAGSPLVWLCGPAVLFLLLFFVWPLTRVVGLSFQDENTGALTLDNYANLGADSFYGKVALTTLGVAVAVTVLCLVLGYPAAYYLVRTRSRYRHVLFIAMIAPLLVSVVVRTIGWLMLLGDRGPVAWLLSTLPGSGTPGQLLFNRVAVVVGMTHVLVPFMILAIAGTLAGVDRRLEEAAAVLGASPARTFIHVTWPLSIPGAISGCVLVFSLTVGAYLTPMFMGGGKIQVVAIAIFDETLVLLDWPQSAALSVGLLSVVLLLLGMSLLAIRRFLPKGGA